MVRFIFVCMGVVAVAVVTLAAQGIYDGIKGVESNITARNERIEDEVSAVAALEEPTAEELNAIMPTAGEQMPVDPNDTFHGGFTNEAPAALSDTPASEPMLPQAVVEGLPD